MSLDDLDNLFYGKTPPNDVDVLGQLRPWKNPVRVATTGNGTLSTAYAAGQTVDGVVLAEGDRILLKDQTDGTENGVYNVAATGAPSRASDMENTTDAAGAFVFVVEGTSNAESVYYCSDASGSANVGTDALTFAQFSGAPGPGTTDHGALSGLVDDDHTQYSLADGSRGVAQDNVFRVQDSDNLSRQAQFNAGLINSGTTRLVTIPDHDATISRAQSIYETGGPADLPIGGIASGEALHRDESGNITGDPNVLHSDRANEFAGLSPKGLLNSDDWLLIEDAEDSRNKKRVSAGVLGTGGGGGDDVFVEGVAVGGANFVQELDISSEYRIPWRLNTGPAPDEISAYIDIATLEGKLDHDNLLGVVANQHIDWTNASSNLVTDGTIVGFTAQITNGNTLIEADNTFNGKIVYCTAGTTVTFRLGDNMSLDCGFVVAQAGLGQVNFTAINNVLLRYDTATFNPSTAAQYSMVFVHVRSFDGDVYLSGDLDPI